MDIESARRNMIDCQIKTWDVFDLDVIETFTEVKREHFVPEIFKTLAFADINLDIGYGQTMMSPKLEARLLQSLSLKRNDKVLEIGTGTGHVTALLAKLAREVFSFECHPDLFKSAKSNLEKSGTRNVRLLCENGLTACDQFSPFDVIVLLGSIPNRERKLEELLAIGGRMFAIVGSGVVMDAVLIQRVSESDWHYEVLFETSTEALLGTEISPTFQFD